MSVSARRPIGVGVAGLGFMGRTHIEAYGAANAAGFANKLVAVCSQKPEELDGKSRGGGNLATGASDRVFDPAVVRGYPELDQLIADKEVELVSICTHTATHVDFALRALAAGKHVLVEKPVALTANEVEPLARAAREARTLCMPGHCLRFWPGWRWLADRVREGTFGAPRSFVARRLAGRPDWSPEFYGNPNATGGALLDLHIHDADFIRFCFGAPRAVLASGSLDHVTALYRFAKGPAHVAAEGGWDHSGGFAFRMGYLAVFEQATVEFDSMRERPLILHRDGKVEPLPLEPGGGHDGEIRHLLGAIAEGRNDLLVTIDDALATARLLDAERESLARGTAISLL